MGIAVPVHPALAELVAAGEWMARNRFIPATSGNLSCRISATEIVITPSGIDKGNLTPSDLIRMNIDDLPPEGTSAETALHVQLYRDRPAARAVLHGHSLITAQVSLRHQACGFVTLCGYELLKAFRGVRTHEARIEVPIFANSQNMSALADTISAELAHRPEALCYLLAGHGSYVWGESVAEARRHFEALEFLLELHSRIQPS
jgi:methylthioribulose-1-phosphate dehydratase